MKYMFSFKFSTVLTLIYLCIIESKTRFSSNLLLITFLVYNLIDFFEFVCFFLLSLSTLLAPQVVLGTTW